MQSKNPNVMNLIMEQYSEYTKLASNKKYTAAYEILNKIENILRDNKSNLSNEQFKNFIEGLKKDKIGCLIRIVASLIELHNIYNTNTKVLNSLVSFIIKLHELETLEIKYLSDIIIYLEKLEKLEPDNIEHKNNIIKYLTVLSNLKPLEIEYLHQLAHLVLNVSNDNALSIQYCDRILKINPQYHYALFFKGMALFGLRKYKESVRYFDLAIKQDPNNAECYYFKAMILNLMGNYQDANTNINLSLNLDINKIDYNAEKIYIIQKLLVNKINIEFEKDKNIEDKFPNVAELPKRKYIEHKFSNSSELPTDKDINLINSLKQTPKYKEVNFEAEFIILNLEYVQNNDSTCNLIDELKNCYYKILELDEKENEKWSTQKTDDLFNENQLIIRCAIEYAINNMRFKPSAIENINDGIKLAQDCIHQAKLILKNIDSENSNPINKEALIKKAKPIFKKAMTAIIQVKNLDSENDIIHKIEGDFYFARRQYEQAIECYQEALKLNPQDIKSCILMGDNYYEKKDYEQAAIHYKNALKLDPDNVKCNKNLGHIMRCYYKDFIQAKDYYQAALRILNNNIINNDDILKEELKSYISKCDQKIIPSITTYASKIQSQKNHYAISRHKNG